MMTMTTMSEDESDFHQISQPAVRTKGNTGTGLLLQ